MTAKKGKAPPPEEDDDDDRSSDDEEVGEGDADKPEGKVERDASTRGVAKSLGVDDDDEEEGEGDEPEDDKKAAAPNRAARRREEALARRQGKKQAAKADDEDDDDEEEGADEAEEEPRPVAARDALPKDKNARAKELLKRRREAAETKGTDIGLSASEVMQDQLARAGSAAGRWFQRNFRLLIAAAILGIAGVVGTIYYLDYREESRGKTTDELMAALMGERGYVFNDERKDLRPEAQQKADPTPVFASFAARNDAVLAAYTKVSQSYPGTGAALLARLGEAGTLLDMGQLDQALVAFEDVLKSPLAKADVDVRLRATEGKGFALEGKKDLDGALAVFIEIESIDKSFEDLARMHQARIHFRKGDKEKAKELLKAIDKKLEIPTPDGPQQPYVRAVTGEYLRYIDPASAKKAPFGGMRRAPSPEEAEQQRRLIQQLMEQQQQKEDASHGADEELPQAPPGPGGDDGTH